MSVNRDLIENTRGSPSRGQSVSMVVGLFLVVTLAYLPSMGNGFIYDDHEVVLWQRAPTSIFEIEQIFKERHFSSLPYYRPITRTSLLLQKSLHGNTAGYFHLANAILIGLTACAAFALLRTPVFAIQPVLALLGAALFSLHPTASSCVYPAASGRETLLPALLIIATMAAFLRPGRKWYALALFGFAVALFSKELAVTVPVLFVWADLLQLTASPPGRNIRRWLLRYAPVAMLVLFYLTVRWSLFEGHEYRFAVLKQPFGSIASFGYALQTAFVPYVEFFYEPPIGIWPSAVRLIVTLALTVGLLVAVVRRGRSFWPLALFWLGWFTIVLMPTANVIEQEAHFAERYVFLAIVPLIGTLAMVLSAGWERTRQRRTLIGAGILLVVASGAISIHRCQYFKDDLAFFQQWSRTNPGSATAQEGFAVELIVQGRLDESVRALQAALQGDRVSTLSNLWLGQVLVCLDQYDAAIEQFQTLVRLQPDFAGGYACLGDALRQRGRHTEAITQLQKAVKLIPTAGGTHYVMSKTYREQQSTGRADQHNRLALQSEVMILNATTTTDTDMARLQDATNLIYLDLNFTRITDAGLKSLKRMTKLGILNLWHARITDAGLAHLSRLSKLRSLQLTGTPISDNGLEHLKGLTNLQTLDVRGTKVTAAGVKSLQKLLPSCEITF